MDRNVVLPHDWIPRPYQRPLWDYLEAGGKRAVAVWHRRSGKDSVALNRAAIAMWERVGTYWHMLPEQAQARKVIWDGIDCNGKRMIDQAFPIELRQGASVQEMKITAKNGSIWQLCGSDNFNSLVGSNPVGVVMSEYAIANPMAWGYLRPILAENGGWALFNFTPRGKNHGFELYKMAKENEAWFSELLTIDDTKAISQQAVLDEIKSGMDEDLARQEFWCSFEAALKGAYYGKHIDDAVAQGRICSVPYDPAVPVHTSWDIGVDDATAIWFWQALPGGEIHAIEYLEDAGHGIEHYLVELRNRHYIYGTDYVPHDMESRSFAAGGRSAADIARKHGRKLIVLKGMPSFDMDRIQPGRTLFPRIWFDKVKCDRGLECLKSYRREYDDKQKTWKTTPLHDWSSHGADAFAHFAIGFRDVIMPQVDRERYRSEFPGRQAGNSWMNS